MPIKLETSGLRMEYVRQRDDSRFVALDNINVQVEDKKFVALVGPSGCGKTTFIKIVDGLITPTAGRIPDRRQTCARPGHQSSHGVPGALPAALADGVP